MRAVCVSLLLIWPVVLSAQTVSFRTGEHADFTRVVAFLPEDTAWQVGRTAEGYVMRLPGVAGFDLTGFFDLIPRARIRDAAAQAEDLQLSVDCQCHVRAFLYRPGILVMDVLDGPAPRISPFELALPGSTAPPDDPAAPTYRVQDNQLLPLIADAQGRASVEASGLAVPEPAKMEPARPSATAAEVDALAQSITQSLAQGLTAGVLAPAERDALSTDDPLIDLQAAIAALPGITARNSTDPLADPSVIAPATTQAGDLCLPDAFFAVADWADPRPFYDQLATARRATVKETGVSDDAAVTALAQLYLAFGFGREAVQTLATDGAQSRERLYLTMLGHILDEQRVPRAAFAGQVSCDGPVALWAMLAQDPPPIDAVVARSAALKAYRALPVAVRAAIRARVAERFVQIGDLDAASQVLNPDAPLATNDPESALASATLSAALGDVDTARQSVAAVARTGPRSSPAAMTRYFRDGISAGLVFSDDDFLLADALRFEFADTAEAAALTAAQIAAFAADARFDAGLRLLADSRDTLTAADYDDLRGDLWQDIAARTSDASFLRYVWEADGADLAAETQNALAARLLDLGFPERAETLLTADAAGPAADRRALLQARLALARNDAATAIRLLRTQDTAEALNLVEEALAMQRSEVMNTGRVDAALPRPTDADPARAAILQDAATLVATPEPGTLSADSPLQDGRALLERSAQSRATLDALLDQFAVPPDF